MMGDGAMFVLGINVGLAIAVIIALWADPDLLAALIRESMRTNGSKSNE